MSEHPVEDEAPSQEGDWFLAMLIKALNELASKGNDTAAMGVTFWVGGAMVSGELVGAATYFRGLRETFREALGGDDSFDSVIDGVIESTTAAVDDDQDYTVGFVHLRDARTFVPGQAPIPANRGIWWRARIESIDAVSFGILVAERRPA